MKLPHFLCPHAQEEVNTRLRYNEKKHTPTNMFRLRIQIPVSLLISSRPSVGLKAACPSAGIPGEAASTFSSDGQGDESIALSEQNAASRHSLIDRSARFQLT